MIHALPSEPIVAVRRTPTSIAGGWKGTWTSDARGDGTTRATFAQTGESIDGTMRLTGSPCFDEGRVAGSLSGGTFSATFAHADAKVMFDARLDDGVLEGRYVVVSGECRGDTGTFSASHL
jgi:hypothetical protein